MQDRYTLHIEIIRNYAEAILDEVAELEAVGMIAGEGVTYRQAGGGDEHDSYRA